MSEIIINQRRNHSIGNLQQKLTNFIVKKRRSSSFRCTNNSLSDRSFLCIPTLREEKQSSNSSDFLFDKILNTTHLCLGFRKFLKKEHAEENLDFWLAVEHFRNKPEESEAQCLMDALKIYKKFILTGSEFEINLDGTITREIYQNLNLVNISPSLFDDAQREIYLLIKRDSYPRFKRTIICEKC
jgi:hypothetical protein